MKAVNRKKLPWPWGVIWHSFCAKGGEPVLFHTSWYPHLYEHLIMEPDSGEWI